MDNLMIKDVAFNGAQLKAIKYPTGDIYVGMANVCDAIGFKKAQRDRFIKTAKGDELYEEGIRNCEPGEFDPQHPIIAIKLDYLPIWLCKMRITKQTKLENPGLYENLKTYQLMAKDVLFSAFMPEHSTELTIYKQTEPTQSTDSPNVSLNGTMVASMLNMMNELTSEVRRIGNALENLKVVKNTVPKPKETMEKEAVKLITEDKKKSRETREFNPYNRKVTLEKKAKDVVKYSKGKYKYESEVLSDVYSMVGEEFKIDWLDEITQIAEKTKGNGTYGLIDVIVNNNVYFDMAIDLLNTGLPSTVRDQGKRPYRNRNTQFY